ncbi:MAG: ABC transporter ATP-binding protein [Actinomycetota bacterium]|nr:ABC transporter ATP-binding protein [Actinomycetota bacterium]
MTAAIETRGLRKRFRRVEALRGADIDVPEGSVCGFLGPNGAGKTTTMEILMGLIRPSGGWASIFGNDLGNDGFDVRSRIGYLPQDASFFPRSRVRDVLRFVARRYVTGTRSAVEARVDETLELVGLETLADRRVKALSGGERQRLGIGQAVIGGPNLLILDEPSVGLDPEGRRQVLDLLEGFRQEMTIFYSSHVLDDVERIADHIVVIDRGVVVEQGPMAQYIGGRVTHRVALDGGDARSVMERIERESWVSGVRAMRSGEWEIESTDQRTVERNLLRVLAGTDSVRVVSLRPMQRSLEDLYVDLVGGVDDD